MRVPIIFAVAVLSPALVATTDDKIPIAGDWKAEPSPGIVGPAGLTISNRLIAFGSNSETIIRWSTQENIVIVDTAIGHSYSFRKETASRICLISSMRPRSVYGTSDAMQIRCYTKPTDTSGSTSG